MRRLGFLCLLICALIGALIILQNREGDKREKDKKERKIAIESRQCRVEATDDIPSWVTSGVWLADSLLLADVTERRLVRISTHGKASNFEEGLEDKRSGPIRIKTEMPPSSSDAGFIIEFADGRLLSIDRRFRKNSNPVAVVDLESDGRRIAALLDWVSAGESIVGYADIYRSTGRIPVWKNGFVRFNLAKSQSFTVIRERPFPDEARISMTLTYPLIASIGSTVYVALLDGGMGLWRLGPSDQDLQPMRAFPPPLSVRAAPKLPTWRRKEEYPGVMAAAERATMPAGLWSWEGALFFLARAFEGGGQRWYLSKIDPVRDEVLWTVPIPSMANHITVIPGSDAWAFLEKGPVVAWLSQETHSILFVKSSQMRSSNLRALCP